MSWCHSKNDDVEDYTWLGLFSSTVSVLLGTLHHTARSQYLVNLVLLVCISTSGTMSDDPTPLSLPLNLPYPITLTRLIVQPGDDVKRGTRLAEYSFMSRERQKLVNDKKGKGLAVSAEEEGNDLSGTWDCLVSGEIVGWEKGVRAGMVIERRDAKYVS